MDEQSRKQGKHLWVYIEDALLLVTIVLLFVLTIFFRHELWAQYVLAALLVLMLIVFIRRLRRASRAFKGE